MTLRAILIASMCFCGATAAGAREYTSQGWYIVYLKSDGQPEKPATGHGPYATQAECQRVFDGAPPGVEETPKQLALRAAQIFNKMGCVLLTEPLPDDR